tara:strand:+ start:1018 stop:1260 length:243 start_codon:yes stop_codon:yes gene_type:complete
MSAEYHKKRRIAEPELYRSRGKEYSRRYRENKKRALEEEKMSRENRTIDAEIMSMTVNDLADMLIDNDDSDPDSTPSGVI